MGASAFCASSSYLEGSLLYCSMYMRMVAPEDPVPDRRKMMREPSACVQGTVRLQVGATGIWVQGGGNAHGICAYGTRTVLAPEQRAQELLVRRGPHLCTTEDDATSIPEAAKHAGSCCIPPPMPCLLRPSPVFAKTCGEAHVHPLMKTQRRPCVEALLHTRICEHKVQPLL